MAKGGKSSATSATRKKHAKKAAAAGAAVESPQQKPKANKKKTEPRIKAYVAPLKPAPAQPDPLDTTGLAHRLPPELLVVLRSFNKKAQVTKIRALEELQAGWIDKCQDVHVLADMLPVWLHHVPALFVHPSRRLRLLAASVHLSLVQLDPVRDHLLFLLPDSPNLETLIGTWSIAAHDIDKQVSATALKSWLDVFTTTESHLPPLIAFVHRTILDPRAVYTALNPIQPDEHEESDTDRKARLRVGALGAVRRIIETTPQPPSTLIDLFQNPALWSALYHAEQCPFVAPDLESFGHAQPNVRKSAWALVLALLVLRKAGESSWIDGGLVRVMSVAILRSAWVEPDTGVHALMWEPLLRFLKGVCWALLLVMADVSDGYCVEFPGAWEVERDYEYGDEAQVYSSMAYREFLGFLERGCNASPVQGYPAVVVILSTIPSSILASATTQQHNTFSPLLTALWAVLPTRVLSSLHRAAASRAFIESVLECVVFLIRRAVREHERGEEIGVRVPEADLVRDQIGKVWIHLERGELGVDPRAAARVVGRVLGMLGAIEFGLFDAAWDVLGRCMSGARETKPGLVAVFWKVVGDWFRHGHEGAEEREREREKVEEAMSAELELSVRECSESLEDKSTIRGVSFLVEMLDQFREGLFEDVGFAEVIDALLTRHAPFLIHTVPTLVLSYLAHRKSSERSLDVWHAVLGAFARSDVDVDEETSVRLGTLVDAVQRGVVPAYLRPAGGEVDGVVKRALERGLEKVQGEEVVLRVLQVPDWFMSVEGYTASLRTIECAFGRCVDWALRNEGEGEDEDDGAHFGLGACEKLLRMIGAVSRSPPRELPTFGWENVLSDVFVLAFLLPASYDDHAVFDLARSTWEELYVPLDGRARTEVRERICGRLREVLGAVGFRSLPEDVLEMVWKGPSGITFDILRDIFPSAREIDEALSQLPTDPIHPSLAVITPLIPPSSSSEESGPTNGGFDKRGFSSYARVVSALLHVFIHDRQIARHNLWAVRHLLALGIYARDFVSVPGARDGRVFGDEAIHAGLEMLVGRVEQVVTYVLTTASEEGWRGAALDAVLGEEKDNHKSGPLTPFLVRTIRQARGEDCVRDTRILRSVLQHVFYDVEREEADRWVGFARKIEGSAPETSMAIVYAVTNFAPEPPRLDRYRNELAASLLGVPPAKANTEGLLTLRRLCACAPNLESDVVFLPQPRAVNITKACQKWIASDEELDGEVLSAITAVFLYLVPILQDLSGAHWELMFDVVESNLEESSLVDDATLVSLARTLRLVMLIQDLSLTNKLLRASWEERKMPILTMVRDLATVSLDDLESSIPRSTCRGLLLSIVQDLPPSLIDQGTFSKMCHLVMDHSVDVQKMAYHFLGLAAKKRTEYLVIEAGVDSEGSVNMDLSEDLLSLLQRNVVIEDAHLESSNVFGYLLAWMLLFDLFHGSSLKVRSSYIEQLRNINVVVEYFIPTVLGFLRLDQGPHKAFKLDIWAVDEFHVEYYEPGSKFGLSVLAAHLYYRALLTVPSLIHTWVSDCKDRQMSTSITNYTSQCFSPVIIRTELTHLKSPESTSNLVDENFTVKVANSVNEVVASYSVDEHQLEIKLKIPADWPLHKIEIKDLKRVGVDENRWRAWILAVQQIIWSHDHQCHGWDSASKALQDL
ncbi:hypothetical protein C0995_012648 [Termitomyces sp. Mi166|nr:hypothetical protein C0995_012648 [Termitomyces sp. Mi166\